MGAGTFDRRVRVKCTETHIPTGRVITSRPSVGEVRTSTANLRRKRPTPLGNTSAAWYNTKTESQFYTKETKTWVTEGIASFVWPSGPITETNTSSAGNSDTAVDRATRRFANNTGAGISGIELPSTVRMIGRRAKTFYDAVRLMGKGNYNGLAKLMKSQTGYNISSKSIKHMQRKFGNGNFSFKRAAAAWLEFNFGWQSFFQSIYDSVESLGNSSQIHSKNSSYGGASAGFSGQITNRYQFNMNRLGLGNPAELLWDKLRLSFVIDWFIPITPFLQTLSAGRGMSRISGFKSHSTKHQLFTNGYLVKTHTGYIRTAINFGVNGLQIAPTGGLWKTITSLSLFSGMR